MKKLLILGAGTAGTMMANKLHRRLDLSQWAITVVDRDDVHYYQPGFLFVPFGIYQPKDVVKTRREFLPSDVNFVIAEVEKIEPDQNRVALANAARWTTTTSSSPPAPTFTPKRPRASKTGSGPLEGAPRV